MKYFQSSALDIVKNGGGKREKTGPEEVGKRVKVGMVQGNDHAGFLDLIVIDDHVYLVSDIVDKDSQSATR